MNDLAFKIIPTFLLLAYKIGWTIWWFMHPEFTAMQIFRKAIGVD